MAISEKTASTCSACGYVSLQWVGRCPHCGEWDSFEQVSRPVVGATPKAISMEAVERSAEQRFETGIGELDRVFGGGLVPGSLVLLAGEPGVGKSTLTLQVAAAMEKMGRKILMVCGEESIEQVARRQDRLGLSLTARVTDCTEVNGAVSCIEGEHLVIVDSVQTMRDAGRQGEPGSVSQVRAVTSVLASAARERRAAIVLVGHITKDGSVAGPRALEHLVDAVAVFEGDRTNSLRALRAVKNRFGPSGEVGLFTMESKGLQEVSDPSAMWLTHGTQPLAGCSISCAIEGRRARVVEIQSLVSRDKSPVPRRVAQGVDTSRLGLMLAVLDAREGASVMSRDVYACISGGLKANDPALDLAICISIASSLADRPIAGRYAFVAEVGLAGELRPVPAIDARVRELLRLGFEKVVVSDSSVVDNAQSVVRIKSVKEAISLVL